MAAYNHQLHTIYPVPYEDVPLKYLLYACMMGTIISTCIYMYMIVYAILIASLSLCNVYITYVNEREKKYA